MILLTSVTPVNLIFHNQKSCKKGHTNSQNMKKEYAAGSEGNSISTIKKNVLN